MKNKKIILIITIIAVILGIVIYQFFIKEKELKFTLEKVSKGTIVREVSETGIVRISEEVNLSFQNPARIEKMYVEVGDIVKAGQELAKLDTSQLLIQLNEAQAALEVARAKKIDTQVSLENARQNLEDVEADADEDLENAYEDAVNTLNDAYFKIYKTYNVVYGIQKDYFTSANEKEMKVVEERYKIKSALEKTKNYTDNLENNPQYEDIDLSLSNVKKLLKKTRDSLEVVRDVTGTEAYRNLVSDSDKTSLDTQKSNINAAYTDIVNSQQVISTIKVENEANINTAKAEVAALEAQLQENGEISGLHQAQINQAKAQVSLFRNQIQESTLKSPNKGQITKVNKKEGETVQLTESVISLLPTGPFQIKVDIYEEDIVDVKIGNLVDIILAAFPEQVFKGRVVSINPAEELIEGVVYYEITIDFEETKEGIKPGMTADIVIETDKKENVLVISEDVLVKINGKKIVKIFNNGTIEEREIEIGLEGDNDLIEVISGLEEGEKVVIE